MERESSPVWADIEQVPLFAPSFASLKLLPGTEHMLNMSHHFSANARGFSFTPNEELDAIHEAYMSWASVIAFDSVFDCLRKDLRKLKLLDAWDQSDEKAVLDKDPLVLILSTMRNSEVHEKMHPRERKPFTVGYSGDPQIRDMGGRTYFTCLDETKPISTSRKGPKISALMVAWFNRQAQAWPTNYLTGVARARVSEQIDAFLKRVRAVESTGGELQSSLPEQKPGHKT